MNLPALETSCARFGACLTIGVLLAVASCTAPPDDETEPNVIAEGDATGGAEAPTLPPPVEPEPGPMVRESISIEGSVEEIEARRYTAPAGFPLGFSTVIPGDMVVEQVSSGEGDAIHVTAEFGGVREPDAVFIVMVLPEGTDEATARERIAALGATPEPEQRAAWDLEEFDLTDTPGFVALGEREGRWFYLLARYPPEYGDGMAPRLDLILRRWEWADGSSLLP